MDGQPGKADRTNCQRAAVVNVVVKGLVVALGVDLTSPLGALQNTPNTKFCALRALKSASGQA